MYNGFVLSDDVLRSRFRGALLGLTIGDALAFPYRGRSREFSRTRAARIDEGFEKHESGFYPEGQYSDDSQTALCIAAGLVEARGVVPQTLGEHLIPLWRDHLVIEGTPGSSAALESFMTGRATVADCGRPRGQMDGDVLPRAVPIGLWCHDRPESVASAAGDCCSITHRDQRVQAAAAGIAAATAYVVAAEEIVLGRFLDRVAAACGRYHGGTAERLRDFPRLLSITEYRVFEQVGEFVAEETGDAAPSFNAGVPDNGLFLFLLAIYYFLKSPFDVRKALRIGLGVGGETTTLCSLVCALGGAFLGEEGLPPTLALTVHEREETLETADAVFDAWREKRR